MIIGGIVAIAAVLFIFKDQFAGICTKISIPFLCPSEEERAKMLADPRWGTGADAPPEEAMYAGYY